MIFKKQIYKKKKKNMANDYFVNIVVVVERRKRDFIRRKVDLNAVGEVLRPHRIWSSLPNLARATLF